MEVKSGMDNLREFCGELHNVIIDNDIMSLKLEAISEEIVKIKEVANKYEQFSKMNLILTGIAKTLEDIINK